VSGNSNAAATPAAGVRRAVSLVDARTQPRSKAAAGGVATGEREMLVIELVDTGIGISARGRDSLFAQYCQGSADEMERPRAFSGTGLGLSICARQVRPWAAPFSDNSRVWSLVPTSILFLADTAPSTEPCACVCSLDCRL
jgi:Histidine kinase-, DNA gyrase B-, and HSP90-like ATPase